MNFCNSLIILNDTEYMNGTQFAPDHFSSSDQVFLIIPALYATERNIFWLKLVSHRGNGFLSPCRTKPTV